MCILGVDPKGPPCRSGYPEERDAGGVVAAGRVPEQPRQLKHFSVLRPRGPLATPALATGRRSRLLSKFGHPSGETHLFSWAGSGARALPWQRPASERAVPGTGGAEHNRCTPQTFLLTSSSLKEPCCLSRQPWPLSPAMGRSWPGKLPPGVQRLSRAHSGVKFLGARWLRANSIL